jgi:hypothetical protein
MDGRTLGSLRAGYLAHSPAPITERMRLIYVGDMRDRPGITTWLKSRQVDSVIFLEGDLLRLLQNAGFRIPQDFAVVSLSKHQQSPEVCGVEQSAEALGRAAVDLVTAQIQRHEFGRLPFPQKLMLDGQWSLGTTLPRRVKIPARAKPLSSVE